MIDPLGQLQPLALVPYELANNEVIRQRVYSLDTRIVKADRTIIADWDRQPVAQEDDNETGCLAGIRIYNTYYSSTNPGGVGADGGGRHPPQLRLGRLKGHVTNLPAHRTTG